MSMFGGAQTQSKQSPAVTSLKVNTSCYGRAIPWVRGTNRLTGNLIWYGDFASEAHQSASSGKGGADGGGSVSYTYSTKIQLALCEGPILGIGQVWKNKKKTNMAGIDKSYLFVGNNNQQPWNVLSSIHPEKALSYSGVAIAAFGPLDLGNDSTLPNLAFEVQGQGASSASPDADAGKVVQDFLTDVGWDMNLYQDLGLSDYAAAAELRISPVLEEQAAAADTLKAWLQTLNCDAVFSDGRLKIAPYADATVSSSAGGTYTPDLTPAYDLTDDDFIVSGPDEEPIICERKYAGEIYNEVTIEYLNRGREYNITTYTARDQAHIDKFGLKSASSIQAHWITTTEIAKKVAQLILWRGLFVRNVYKFKLGWRYCRLEPHIDFVTLTTKVGGLRLARKLVRIVSIEEDDDGILSVEAEEVPGALAEEAVYPHQDLSGEDVDFNFPPGPVTGSVIWEPPATLARNGLQVWVGACGGSNWGGAEVWVSTDGEEYARWGVISSSARIGTLSSLLPKQADPDLSNVIRVIMRDDRATLTSVSKSDADALATLAVIGGSELVAYKSAALSGIRAYNLTYLRRGQYGTSAAQHRAGASFMRLDQAVLKLDISPDQAGQTLLIKLRSFNVQGGGLEDLSEINPITFHLTGAALLAPLPNVTNLTTIVSEGWTHLRWNSVTDWRSPIYEVRQGDTFETARIIGRPATPDWRIADDGTYWVTARYVTPGDIVVYSAAPVAVVVEEARLPGNVVATQDQAANGWQGTFEGGLALLDIGVATVGLDDVLGINDAISLSSIIWQGTKPGTYTIPESDIVNIGRSAACAIRVRTDAKGVPVFSDLFDNGDILGNADVTDAYYGPRINSLIEIRIAPAGASPVWSDWQTYRPGSYVGQYFQARITLSAWDDQTVALMTSFVMIVDMPDRTASAAAMTVPAEGRAVTYPHRFVGGPDGASTPAVQITVRGAQAGDVISITDESLTGFTVQIFNGGVGVARSVHYTAVGY